MRRRRRLLFIFLTVQTTPGSEPQVQNRRSRPGSEIHLSCPRLRMMMKKVRTFPTLLHRDPPVRSEDSPPLSRPAPLPHQNHEVQTRGPQFLFICSELPTWKRFCPLSRGITPETEEITFHPQQTRGLDCDVTWFGLNSANAGERSRALPGRPLELWFSVCAAP